MMIKTKLGKLFCHLLTASSGKSFCLVLFLHLCTFHFATTISREDPPKKDSIFRSSLKINGEIFVSGGANICDAENNSGTFTISKTKNKKTTLTYRKEKRYTRPETPKRPQIDTANSNEKTLVSSRSSGVSFSNKSQTENFVLQHGSGNALFLKTDRTISYLSLSLLEKLEIESQYNKIKQNSFRPIFCTRPPPFS